MKLLATPFGTFLKTFVSTILAMYIAELTNGITLYDTDSHVIEKLLTGGLISSLPVIINWLNPHYNGYGINGK